MRIRLIARVALSALLLTVMLVVKADDSESGGPWKQNYKLAATQKLTGGSTTIWVQLPGSTIWVPVTVQNSITINCCVQATDSDACNTALADSRC
jgi:hypothetical protein